MISILRQLFGVALATAILIVALGFGIWSYSSLFEEIYAGYVRDTIQYSCGKVTHDELWYTLRPGTCHFKNLEFDTTVSVDPEGFRNSTSVQSPQLVVIGDSMAMGWGVNDDEVFSSILQAKTGLRVRNLAISSWATARELAAAARYANSASVVILQYSENDFPENKQLLTDPKYFVRQKEELAGRFVAAQVDFSSDYNKPLITKIARGLRGLLKTHRGLPPAYRIEEASLREEAETFRLVVESFAPFLSGKLLIVFESNHFGLNRRAFQAEFQAQLNTIDGLNAIVLNSRDFLDGSHYFTLDDHLNVSGHLEIAKQLEKVLSARAVANPGL